MSGNTKEETEQQFVSEAPVEEENGKKRTVFRGELALFITVMINSFGVVLMLYSGAGISAISSVPFAFSEVAPVISLGTEALCRRGNWSSAAGICDADC